VDNAATKFHRQDITRIIEIGKYFEKTQGNEAVQEYIQHIHDDVKVNLSIFFEDLEKDYTLKSLEERIIIYADRLVDIVMDGVAGDWEAENRFEEILKTIPRYGKNDLTLERYPGYHKEIQGLINR
jgi:hypothetical protein